MECTWDPRPASPSRAPKVGIPGVRDPVIWTGEELRILNEGLGRFAAQENSSTMNQFPNKMTRYIQLAALLPSKSVRDVALRVAQQESIPSVAQKASANMSLPEGIDIVDHRHHDWLNSLLTSNVALINQMRDNLVQKKAHDNMHLYSQFRKQAKTVQNFLSSLSIQLPEPNFTVAEAFASERENGEFVSSVES